MNIGYARVSTLDQNLDLQKDTLEKAHCEKIFEDIASGAKSDRSGLQAAIDYCRSGDTLVVWKLDRLGRSIRHLIETITHLEKKGVGFKSLQESMDTTTSGGKLIFHIFGALAEFERELIRERTQAGLNVARVRGKKGGRPRVMDDKKIAMAKALHQDVNNSIQDICGTLKIKRSTLYKYIHEKST